VVLPVVVAVAVIGFGQANNAAEAANAPKPAKVWSNEECLSCHVNKHILLQMQSKRGDPTYCQAAYDRLIKQRAAGKPESLSYKK
jgi:cytochrome c peroxidase